MPKTVKPEIVVRRLTKALAAAEDVIAELTTELKRVRKEERSKLKRLRDANARKQAVVAEKHDLATRALRTQIRVIEARNSELQAQDERFKKTYPEQWVRLNMAPLPQVELVPDTPERRAAFSRKLTGARGKDVLAYPDR